MEGRGTKGQRRKKKVYVKPYNNTLNFNLFSIIIVSALGEGEVCVMSNFEFGVCPCACARRLSATTLPCESQPMTSAYVANSVGTVYSFILERQRTKCVGLRFSSVPLPIQVADWGKIWRANTDA